MDQISHVSAQDVLRDEHRAIVSLLNEPDCLSVGPRGEQVRRHFMTTLVRHFVAEERYLYPVVRRQLAQGDDFVERAVATNRESELLLSRLGDPTLTAMGLADLWKEVRGGFATHVGRHDPILNVLAEQGDSDLLTELGQSIRVATETVAPMS